MPSNRRLPFPVAKQPDSLLPSPGNRTPSQNTTEQPFPRPVPQPRRSPVARQRPSPRLPLCSPKPGAPASPWAAALSSECGAGSTALTGQAGRTTVPGGPYVPDYDSRRPPRRLLFSTEHLAAWPEVRSRPENAGLQLPSVLREIPEMWTTEVLPLCTATPPAARRTLGVGEI